MKAYPFDRRNKREASRVAIVMARIDEDTLARMLASVDLRVGMAHRAVIPAGGILPLPTGRATLGYVVSGIVDGAAAPVSECRVDIAPGSREVTVAPHTATGPLTSGDAFLTLGRTALPVGSEEGATLIVVDLEFSDSTAQLATALPALISVYAFNALEPAAAALVSNMGHDGEQGCARSGDPVICRMMATTVLLSVVRAWADAGCAPEGWPTRHADPFLTRVVEAIHDQPGLDWSLEQLASVGAMSRTVFAERFRRAMGRSPAHYVTEVRMDAARRLLREGRSVSETSRELGYASDEGFSRAFRRHTGTTPSTWRMTQRPAVLA